MTSAISLLNRGWEVVREVNAQIRSSHQIASRIHEMPPTGKEDLKARIQKLGLEKMVQFQLLQNRRKIIQEALKLTGEETSYFVSSLAMSQFGVGECGEMAASVIVKINQYATCGIVSSGSTQDIEDYSYNHAFVVLFENEAEARGFKQPEVNHLSLALEALPENAVIVDPLLKFACRASEIPTKGLDLLEYNKVWNLKFIWRFDAFKMNSDALKQNVREADNLYKKIQKQIPMANPNGFSAEFLRGIADETRTILESCFPAVNWKSNVKDGITVFAECLPGKADEIAMRLEKAGIKFQKSKIANRDDFCVILKNPPIPEKLKNLIL